MRIRDMFRSFFRRQASSPLLYDWTTGWTSRERSNLLTRCPRREQDASR
ncbi:MAG TPA: hypothetical protein GYA10_09095 [Alphaproteobacteria bacterium]|nr:hypothetical protein [Alphaproteobacteria bacterium]